ncbi:hypothetical protein PFISCL1PPCAC_5363, partial [Pristionchus fissidentatus]
PLSALFSVVFSLCFSAHSLSFTVPTMAALPDLDDLLDQIEGSVTAGAQPMAAGRRGFFDPVPCFSTSTGGGARLTAAQAGSAAPSSSRNGRETEEKLSFLEFLKVTAKEAEELQNLQRLHDDQQVRTNSKRVVVSEKREAAATPAAGGAVAAAAVPQPTPVAAPAKWKPEFEMPGLPDVEDLPPLETREEEESKRNRVREREVASEATMESAAAATSAAVQLRVHTPSPVALVELAVEVQEQSLHSLVHPPTPSPEPCEVAIDYHPQQQPHSEVVQHEGAESEATETPTVAAAAADEKGQEADEEMDEMLAYLAKYDAAAAAPTDVVQPAATPAAEPAAVPVVVGPAAAAAEDDDEEEEPAPPSPIAVTPPTCNTAASFDVVSFQVLPSDAMNESEMERELEQLAEDFPDSDQPELVRNEEEPNVTGDETFYSAVETLSLDRTKDGEEIEGDEEKDEEEEENDNEKEEKEDDGDGDKEEEEKKEENEEEDTRTLAEERQELDLVFVNQYEGVEERVAEVEAANEENAEISIIVDSPSEKEKKEEEDEKGDQPELMLMEDRTEDEKEGSLRVKENSEAPAPLASPSISGDSTASASIEVLDRADVEAMEEEMREEEGKKDDETLMVVEEVAERGVDTVSESEDLPDTVAERDIDAIPEANEELLLEPVPEFAAVEEASDSIAEEESGEMQLQQCFEIGVEDQPQDPSSAAASSPVGRAARFRDRVISDVHEIDGDEELATPSRLTECELQLGKTPPVWIPDADCPACMLCSAKFTFLLRRHHCRACGRVLCAACCNERTVLAYQEDNRKSRVCSPCAATLTRVEEWERERREEGLSEPAANSTNDSGDGGMDAAGVVPAAEGQQMQQPTQQLQVGLDYGMMRKKSILKVRAASVTSEDTSGMGSITPSLSIPSSHLRNGGEEGGVTVGSMGVGSAPRGVVFRDGIKPGEHTEDEKAREEEERQNGARAQPMLKKKSRKRAAVSRRVAALKVEEQLASALPTHARPELLLVDGGVRVWSSLRSAELSLAVGDCVRVAVNRLLTCAVKICEAPHGEGRVMCVVSQGFHALGLDEVIFCWRFDESTLREDEEEFVEEMEEGKSRKRRVDLPLTVIRRVEEILQSCFTSSDLADVRRTATRMPRLHTSIASESDDEPPMTRHTMLVPPSFQSLRHLPLSPSLPYVFAVPIKPSELPWSLAAPNRVLMRLGLASGCYPTPLIIDPSREAVYSEETDSSVLKMFNDIGTWSYRMQHVAGGTVTLSNEDTVVRIPRYARHQMRKIVEINRNMIAWLCDLNTEADSHLICIETEQGQGPYESNIFQKGGERKRTGATFVIIDGALKTPGARVQVSVCEDGVAVRLPSEGLVELINALLDGKDHIIETGAHRLRVEWAELDEPGTGTQLISPIDGLYLGNKMQYGLTLERVISSTVASPSLSDTATRLSHVFNMRENTFPPEDEAKVFSVAELVANEAAGMVDEYLPLLTTIGVDTLALRLTVERDRIEYDVAEWAGLEGEQARFRMSLDKLVPVFVNVLGYIPHGFSIELWISIVNTTPLPVEIQ